ncbi:restriction endonuclease subunit S [Streptomyces griseorubiginosus]|uniref:restriction endonuclease subunit S n=1 Tax=Streptomyces griseorubiginosus TaxID=67304 RepID=UPI00215A9EC2|nr:restriction endonuclease subunit S [Streptomyces griseorubiginosus]
MEGILYPQFPIRRFIANIADGPFGSSLTSSHYADGGARVIRLGNVGSARFKDSDFAYITLEYFKELRRHEVLPGDLIIAGLGDGNNPVGRACVAPDHLGPAIVKADCFRVRLDEERLIHRYAAWALSSSFVSDQVSSLTRGSTRARINLEVVRDIQLPIPSLEEQSRIVNFLDAETARIDRLIHLRSQQVNLLTSRHLSRLSEISSALTERFGEIYLRYFIARIEQGWSPQCEDRLADAGEWGVVKAGCVNTGRFDQLQHKALPGNIEPRREYQLRLGDLLMSRASGSPDLIGSVGFVRELDSNLLLCDKIYRLSVDRTRAKADFVAHMLRSHQSREHIKNGISGAEGMANNLPTRVIRECIVPNVPIGLQDQIAADLDRDIEKTERARAVLERSILLLTERREALISAAVTGQLDVTTARRASVA